MYLDPQFFFITYYLCTFNIHLKATHQNNRQKEKYCIKEALFLNTHDSFCLTHFYTDRRHSCFFFLAQIYHSVVLRSYIVY